MNAIDAIVDCVSPSGRVAVFSMMRRLDGAGLRIVARQEETKKPCPVRVAILPNVQGYLHASYVYQRVGSIVNILERHVLSLHVPDFDQLQQVEFLGI
jgi:tRNA(Phe) wybutosine-synthesizing methylase Tyw3